MTVKQLKARLQIEPCGPLSNTLLALLDCAEALETWRDAVCSGRDERSDPDLMCEDQNHSNKCPCFAAFEGLIAADDQRRKLR